MPLKIIQNEPKFYEFIRILRTHPDNLSGFLEKQEITSEQQIKYMEKYGKDYFICLSGDTPVGFIGVVNEDIRLSVDPKFKKLGIGTFMLNEIKKLPIIMSAKVFLNNIASQKVFEKTGFVKYKSDNNYNYYKYEN
jgi:RimJ/RimL family protein N-acetyltransferase